MTIRVTVAAWLAVVILLLMLVGCQWGIGAQVAPTPIPPATPMPPVTPLPPSASGAGEVSSDEKLIDGYLHVWYIPCPQDPPPPFEWVAPIVLTDLRSGSHVYLNYNGTPKSRPKPRYESEEGQAVLEAALKDDSIVKQIVARPACDDRQSKDFRIRQQGGWPDAYAEDIGEPEIPKVAISTVPASTLGAAIYPGWRGSYCWPVSMDSPKCEDVASWEGFSEAKALMSRPDSTFHFTVLGDEANPGTINWIRMYTIQKTSAVRKFRQAVKRGEEVYSAEAQDGQGLDAIQVPDTMVGDYILIADYESPLGEVEYGFKVAVQGKRGMRVSDGVFPPSQPFIVRGEGGYNSPSLTLPLRGRGLSRIRE